MTRETGFMRGRIEGRVREELIIGKGDIFRSFWSC